MKPIVYTVNGTGVPQWDGPGFAADVGRAFAYDPWEALAHNIAGCYDTPVYWQGVSYAAAVYPMGPSVEGGRAELNRLITLHEQDGLCPKGTPFFCVGYSQGAIVTGEVWAYDILDPAGVHHDRLPDVKGIIQFGDPLRCPGIAYGNLVAGMPMPKTLDGVPTGGIAGPKDLKPSQTPDFLLSCALDGDLYACAPVGADPWTGEAGAGATETGIYNIVQQATFMDLVEVAADLGRPVGTVEAIWNGLSFAAQGVNAPHWRYQDFVEPMVNWVESRI